MPDAPLALAAICPWCNLGKTLADKSADIRISCHCNICNRFYKVDFQTLRVIKTRANQANPHNVMKLKQVAH